ncbi:MAG: hypothetical protein LBL65_05005 [Campylobacteraceae bacterium]|jgi:hypothetical protein|nr:hypothetical protein [Campylobacteraceae bacterium]
MISEKEFAEKRQIKHSYLKNLRYKGILQQGIHYFKLTERKIFIDEEAFDKLLKERNENVCKGQYNLGNLVSKWAKNTKIDRAR